MSVLVLGTGIVGSAAIWDLQRRGHTVMAADADAGSVSGAADRFGVATVVVDVGDPAALTDLMAPHDAVISAVPYRYGVQVLRSAIASGTHYFDFGGNPTVVAAQVLLSNDAAGADILAVPDCGLAPGIANVMAAQLIADAGSDPIHSVQIRVGALPQQPSGALGYQLAFNPAGLINEYAEPCEILEDGAYRTVEPLARMEHVDWDRWGPLEAFSTAGGTSTMCQTYAGRVSHLEYKTLRFPGHGAVFRGLYEIGMFDEEAGRRGVAPRDILLDALSETLPSGEPDLVLVRVWIESPGGNHRTMQFEDTERDGFSALARTTAFPATALADLVLGGTVGKRGVLTMHEAVTGDLLLPELETVGITVEHR